jgi:CHAT domain-containing protein/tetratricopeptide (TPR) repeat protein
VTRRGRGPGLAAVLVSALSSPACALFSPPLAPVELVLPKPTRGVARPEPVALFPSDEIGSAATADGRFLVFCSDETGNLDVWVRDFRTDSVYPRTSDPADDFDPAVSPDGRRIALVSRRADAKGDVFVGDLDGGRLRRRTDDATRDRQPVFSVDGRQLYLTSATPGGLEFVARLDVDGDGPPLRVSPTPGFDPSPSPDGRYLVYTAPPGVDERRHPFLVALRLADSATRALTAQDAGAAGFARFGRGGVDAAGFVYVRFPDDDDGSGRIDGEDHASLWRLPVDLDALFAGGRRPEPVPLTAGSRDELFPDPVGPWLYFTHTARADQDVARLPARGMFPDHDDPADDLRLARSLGDPRERWFALRRVVARTSTAHEAHAEAWLRIANTHLERGRLDLARPAFEALGRATAEAPLGSRRFEYGGIAAVELVSLDRQAEIGAAVTPPAREAVLLRVQRELERLGARFADSARVVARVDLELAEVVVDRGDRSAAVAAFDEVVRRHHDVAYSAARAMIRRTELLGVAFDPDALGEAYARVLAEFPSERAWVNEAARRVVEARVAAAEGEMSGALDAVRSVLERTRWAPVRLAARRWLADHLTRSGRLADAALELAQLAVEAEASGDSTEAARASAERATVEESRGALDEALRQWTLVRERWSDVPGIEDRARAAITRVALAQAREAETRGDLRAARAAYRAVIDNDDSQVRAHRRYLALGAALGLTEAQLEEAAQRARRSPRTPMARYVHALALTWLEPPDLSEALSEVEVALGLNPQFAYAYLTRGWVREMLELDRPHADYLERAIEDYQVAARLNVDADDPLAEAEASLNLGNARWRLAARTLDSGNIGRAFVDYADRLQTGVPFPDPRMELVFWERFARAAAWLGEWAVAATAGREALSLADRLQLTTRLPLLWGHQGLVYLEAGESRLASEAFAQQERALEALGREPCRGAALRSRVAVRLGAAARGAASDLDGALEDLREARRLLREGGACRPADIPAYANVPADASRAPFGFDALTELDLNLALAEHVHRRRGDAGAVRELRQERLRVLEVQAADPPAPTLGLVRERTALRVAEARARCREGDLIGCAHRATEAVLELEHRLADEELPKDQGDLESARALALSVLQEELSAVEGAGGPQAEALFPLLEVRLDDAAARLDRFVETSSSADDQAGARRRGRRAAARLWHARGLRALALASRALPSRGRELEALLAGLDRGADQLGEASRAFERALALAERAEDPTLIAAAREGLALSAPRARATTPSARIARAVASSSTAWVAASATVAATLPARWPSGARAARALLARTASAALATGDLETAFVIVDRWLLLDQLGGRPVGGARAEDPADRRLYDWARSATATTAEPGPVPSWADSASRAARARLLGLPADADAVAEALPDDAAFVALVPVGAALELLWVDGSTLARHRAPVRAEALRDAVGRSRDALESGAPPSREDVELLELGLVSPLRARLAEVRRLVLADRLVGEVPSLALPGLRGVATLHVGSAAGFVAAHEATAIAPEGVVHIEPPGAAAGGDLTGVSVVPAEALRGPEGRRPAALAALARRPPRALAWGPPVTLERSLVERARVGLEPAEAGIDRLSSARALETLMVPARTLILDRVRRPPGTTPLDLDLVLAAAGVGLSIVVPETAPDELRSALLAALARPEVEDPVGAAHDVLAAWSERTPAAAAVLLLGAPTGVASEAALVALERDATQAVRAGDFTGFTRALDRLRAHQRASGKVGRLDVHRTYALLVSYLVTQVGDLPRAAARQAEYIAQLESKLDAAGNRARLARAHVDLAQIHARADDAAAALQEHRAAVAAYEQLSDPDGLAGAVAGLAAHQARSLAYEESAESYERAVGIYTAAGAFRAAEGDAAVAARRTLSALGSVYLNRLADTARARSTFERLLDSARSDVERVDAALALARVARRRGEFRRASERAAQAQALAARVERRDLEIEAVVEAANVAWYQGDYAGGRVHCERGLQMADANLASAKKNKKSSKEHVLRKIFALSACGLIDMSTRDFDGAVTRLETAATLAREARLESELATQNNNLGRVYLEFGRVDPAIEEFRRAQALDERLNDRFGLAYDLRNLGTALAERRSPEARPTLERALALSREVRDRNNELRALFALGELARAEGRVAEAREAYEAALPLAERLEVRDLAWQLHRALGLMLLAAGDEKAAEQRLQQAVDVARSITGRAAATDFGPHRYAAFDDLVLLQVAQGRREEAFALDGLSRALARTATLDDARIRHSDPRVPALLATARTAATATVAAAARAELGLRAPRLADILSPPTAGEVRGRLPDDAAVVVYRVTDEALVIFLARADGLDAHLVPVSAVELRAAIGEHARQLRDRSDPTASLARLSGWLLAPIQSRLAGVERLALVVDDALRYVAWPALPTADGRALNDRFVLVHGLDTGSASRALRAPLGPLPDAPVFTVRAEISGLAAPLDLAAKEVATVLEAYPSARRLLGADAKAAFLSAVQTAGAVVHFAGHARLDARDPMAGALSLGASDLPLHDVLGRRAAASLVVLSACETALAGGYDRPNGDELVSLAEAFQLAGVPNVLATTGRVSDVAAASLMKRFFRLLPRVAPARALRQAQQAVRRYFPHPAWWATFALIADG